MGEVQIDGGTLAVLQAIANRPGGPVSVQRIHEDLVAQRFDLVAEILNQKLEHARDAQLLTMTTAMRLTGEDVTVCTLTERGRAALRGDKVYE